MESDLIEPLFFDLRQKEEWGRLKTDMPMEMYFSLLQDVLNCPCCTADEKEEARAHIEAVLQ